MAVQPVQRQDRARVRGDEDLVPEDRRARVDPAARVVRPLDVAVRRVRPRTAARRWRRSTPCSRSRRGDDSTFAPGRSSCQSFAPFERASAVTVPLVDETISRSPAIAGVDGFGPCPWLHPEHLAVRRVDRVRPSLERVHVERPVAVARRVLDVPVERADPERLDRKPEVERQSATSVRCGSPPKLSQHGLSTTTAGFGFGLGFGFGFGGEPAWAVDYSDALEGGIEMALTRVAAEHDEGGDHPGDDEQREYGGKQDSSTHRQGGRVGRLPVCQPDRPWSLGCPPRTVACGGAAAANGPVTTDEPGSFPAAFAARSYAPGETRHARALGTGPARDGRASSASGRSRSARPGTTSSAASRPARRGPSRGTRRCSSRIPRGPERALLRAAHRDGRDASGTRVYVLRPGAPRREPRRDRRADEHLAGVQLPRRRRERHRRHLVRRPATTTASISPGRSSTTASRRTSATTTSASSAGSRAPGTRRTSSRTTTSSD